MSELNVISGEIVDSAIKGHKRLGPGAMESVYERVLVFELRRRGFDVLVQVPQSIDYDGFILEGCYRLDMLVEGRVVVELKAVERILPLHEAQLISYLKIGNYPLGLLINFHVPRLRDGIRRFVN